MSNPSPLQHQPQSPSQPINEQARLDLKLEIVHSMKLEQAISKLFGRGSRLCIFMLLLLGASAFGNLFPGWLLGGLIALLSIWQIAYMPAEKAVLSKINHQHYYDLFTDFEGLEVAEIKRRKKVISRNDSEAIKCLEKVAWVSSLLILDLSRETEKPFTFFERLAARFAGEYSADLER